MSLFRKLVFLLLVFISVPVFAQQNINLLILEKKYNKALEKIDQELEFKPSAELYSAKGAVCKLLQQYQAAAESFWKATELDPGNAAVLGELAEVLTILDNHTDAIDVFKKALTIKPENLVLASKLGSTYINLKDYRNALDVFESIYNRDSTNVYWNKQYAFCVAKTRASDSLAIALYKKLIDGNPRDLSLYTSLNAMYVRVKDEQKAYEILRRGLNEFPGNPELTLKMANYYFGNKQYKEAATFFRLYIDAGLPEYDVLKNYGICLYFNKMENEAIEELEKCMQVTFNDPIVLFYLSLSHKKLSEFELAEDFMQAAIESATPSYLPEMYHHLGQIYGMQRKFEESIKALKESYDQDPESFEILFEIATTYEEYNYNKTLALNYYRSYLKEGGEAAKNVNYALTRIERIKEELFFDE